MRTLVPSLLALLLATPLAAQLPTAAPGNGQLVDGVVAVVGDTVLLLSDVQTELQQLAAAGRLPQDPAQQEQVAEEIFQSRVNDLILLQAARSSALPVDAAIVEEQVAQDMENVQRRFGSETEFVSALAASGMSREQYRAMLAAQYTDRQLIERFVGEQMRNRARPIVSEEQIRAYFEAQRGALGERPASVSLRQVVVSPVPSDSARDAARREAEQVLQELRDGGDFEVLARRFSDDRGTAEHGGDLGWFRTGRMVPEFEQVAFALRPGSTSGLVETDFGYHIIRVERSRGAERQARHILISPEISEADVARARERADSVAAAARAGGSMRQMAERYETPRAEAEVARIPIDRLPPQYATALRDAESGTVVGPFELPDPRGTRWAVVQITERFAAGAYTLDDVRDQIRQRLEQEAMMEQLVADLRGRVHVEIRM